MFLRVKTTGFSFPFAYLPAMFRFTIAGLFAVSIPFVASSQPIGSSNDPEVRWLHSADVSHSFESELERGSTDLGHFSATLHRGQVTAAIPLSDTHSLSIGPGWEHGHFDSDAGIPIPDDLYAAALRLGYSIRFKESWTFRAEARPGIYSDFEDISFDDFNAPVLLTLTYQLNPRLLLAVGLNVNFRSDLATIGGPGVRWQFADDWTLNLFLPKPTIEHHLNDAVSLYAGGEWRSSAYRVAQDFGSDRGLPGLDDNDFSYRELRGLAGIRWQVNRTLGVAFEGGYAFQRKMEFRQADTTFKANGAPFVQLVVNGSF